MTTANPPPRECILEALVAIDGDNLARLILQKHPGLLAHVHWQAEGSADCMRILNRLFPDGLPEPKKSEDFSDQELDELLDRIRQEREKQTETGSSS